MRSWCDGKTDGAVQFPCDVSLAMPFCHFQPTRRQAKATMASSLPPPTGLPPDVGSLLDSIGSGGIGAGSGPATALAAQAAADAADTSGAVSRSAEAAAAEGTGTSGVSSSAGEDGGGDSSSSSSQQQQQQQQQFDPIDFLNSNYQTEASLVSALPTLRSTIAQRIEHLDESISSTIQKQADLADVTATDVARARAAILRLQGRVETVQSKARLSERAVLEITRDLKRLDFAKRHLSRTITALKRLHMLLHAVDRLHAAAYGGDPFPDYGTCANLIDATRLLLGHFDGYMGSIQKMRDVRDAVGTVRLDLREGAVFGFRVVGFGFSRALAKCGGEVPRCGGGRAQKDKSGATAAAGEGVAASEGQRDDNDDEEEEEYDRYANTGYVQSADDAYGAGLSAGATSRKQMAPMEVPPPPMPKELLSEACMVIDALGLPTRREFVGTFCKDHLESYSKTFDPKKNSFSGGGGGNGSSGGGDASAAKSFKISMPSTSGHGDSVAGGSEGGGSGNPNPASLDQIDRRYAYYRRNLRELGDKFRDVFPQNWNVYHEMTYCFLQVTSDHLSSLLTPLRPYRDRDCDDVTILLKALQKTVMFEKEMTAWLQRECGTIFLDGSREAEQAAREAEEAAEIEMDDEKAAIAAAATAAGTAGGRPAPPPAVYGEDGEELEFDESGKAVAAGSAEGIRIKYERKMREKREGRDRGVGGAAELGVGGARHNRPIPVKPLVGVSSGTFDGFMGPYIALEEQNMDEQLVEFTSQREVDTRGELPVFTSSTALFVYIKNSITRCTNLTKGQTFFQLFASFQDTLKKYANVLEGMFPRPNAAVAAASAAINLSANIGIGAALANPSSVAASANSSSSGAQSYRIPPGEEITICHVIDTCEYCADTMEALEDLIRDKIEDKYKDKIDMSGEQEVFHEVTAKGIRVLVSGLENRADKAFRDMASIKWADMDVVGEESRYVRAIHEAICPFVISLRGLLPTSYFRNFCDKFATAFTTTFYNSLIKQKRISESGSQQLLLDVTTLKTLLLKLPVLEEKAGRTGGAKSKQGTKIAPAMYTKMVTKQFQRIEILLKLVGTPSELLVDMFKSQWEGGSALDFQVIMNLKGMKRNEQAIYLEKLGVDPSIARTGATHGATSSNITDHVQALQGRGSDVANKMTSDMANMRAKVENFRLQFR